MDFKNLRINQAILIDYLYLQQIKIIIKWKLKIIKM